MPGRHPGQCGLLRARVADRAVRRQDHRPAHVVADIGEGHLRRQLLGRLLRRCAETHRTEQQAHAVPGDLRAESPCQSGKLLGQRRAADDEPDAGVGRGGPRRQHRADSGADPVGPDEQVGDSRVAVREPGFDRPRAVSSSFATRPSGGGFASAESPFPFTLRMAPPPIINLL